MLKWLLVDLMPWTENVPVDFRTLNVSRKIQTDRVRGLTRETVVGLLANLTSLELRRKEYRYRNIDPEHPRSGTTYDVEGFISILQEMLSDIFHLNDFYNSYPKILYEYCKHIDSDLPYFYWTGRKHRFQDFPLPSFNAPSRSGIERLDTIRISRRSDPGVFVASRCTITEAEAWGSNS